mmetsp:Transcript_42871/g.71346  ORF Transcript_42871/g.71346 Transcript_42871/m.71346 type:complete len:262 (-) Transcript_42871:343-1128(-)
MSGRADALGAMVERARGSYEKCGMDSSALLKLVGVSLDVAGQAGVMFGVGVLAELAKKIIESIDLSRVNKSRCHKLAERIEKMEPVVDELKKRRGVLIAKPLNSYADCVIRAGELVHQSTKRNEQFVLVRWYHAEGDNDEFDTLFQDMQNTLQDLHLAIGTEVSAVVLKAFKEEETIARAKDLRDLKRQLAQIEEKVDAVDGKLNVVDDKMDDMHIDMKQGLQKLDQKLEKFEELLTKYRYQTTHGASSDHRQNKQSMVQL